MTYPVSCERTSKAVVPSSRLRWWNNFIYELLGFLSCTWVEVILDEYGIINDFYTWQGANHTPFVLNPPNQAEVYMDTTIWFVRDFLYDLVCGGVTSTTETTDHKNYSFDIFPNPNNGSFFVRLGSDENFSITVFDNLGREVFFNPEMYPGINRLEIDLPKGIYVERPQKVSFP